MPLRNKIFIVFSLLVLLPLIIVGIVVQHIFTTSKSDEIFSKTENMLIQLNHSLDLILEDASGSTMSVLYNKQLVNVLSEYDIDTQKGYKKQEHVKLFSLFLSGITFNKDHIYGIHVFTRNGQVFSHMDNYKIKDFINLEDQEWYLKAKAAKGGGITFFDEDANYYENNEEGFVSFIRLLRDPNNHEEIGVIKIDFATSYLQQITEQLTGERWQIITKNNEPLMGNQIDPLLLNCILNQSWINDQQSDKGYLCMTNTSYKTGLKISTMISKDYLNNEVKEFNLFLFSFIALSLLITLLISYYMAHYLFKPLELLKKRIKQFQSSKVSNIVRQSSKDELAELHFVYDGMLLEIDYLVSEVYETNLKSSEAEYKALQSQMDPHFIFNTLESINMMAISNNQFQISDMIAELGKLIRYRIRNEDKQIPLHEEIAFARIYVNIMNNRLGDTLEVYWDFNQDLDAMEYLIPKYIIQPLIENSIMHGYNYDFKKVKITVKVRITDNALIISVSDNGAGISKHRLMRIKESLRESSLNKDFENKSQGKSGIALININRRIKLIHGVHSRLIISSVENKGTQVVIHIRR